MDICLHALNLQLGYKLLEGKSLSIIYESWYNNKNLKEFNRHGTSSWMQLWHESKDLYIHYINPYINGHLLDMYI